MINIDQNSYSVSAHWDDEAKVWWLESNIPGLVIEAETLPEFPSLLKDLAPEMLADNVGIDCLQPCDPGHSGPGPGASLSPHGRGRWTPRAEPERPP